MENKIINTENKSIKDDPKILKTDIKTNIICECDEYKVMSINVIPSNPVSEEPKPQPKVKCLPKKDQRKRFNS